MTILNGIIIQGIGDAAKNLEKQREFFLRAGIEERFLQSGTINIDISPNKAEILEPDIEVKDVDWGHGFKETFIFVRLAVIYGDRRYEGYIYKPSESPHTSNIVEILCEHIDGIAYGNDIGLDIPEEKLNITKA